MAGTILFYRGASEATLPDKKDGSIFVIASELINQTTDDDGVVQSEHYGDMYVDISNADRLHIKPKDAIYTIGRAALSEGGILYGQKSVLGRIYFINDYEYVDGKAIPHIIVGDGETDYDQLPTYTVITNTTLQHIQSKVSVEKELISGADYQLNFRVG